MQPNVPDPPAGDESRIVAETSRTDKPRLVGRLRLKDSNTGIFSPAGVVAGRIAALRVRAETFTHAAITQREQTPKRANDPPNRHKAAVAIV